MVFLIYIFEIADDTGREPPHRSQSFRLEIAVRLTYSAALITVGFITSIMPFPEDGHDPRLIRKGKAIKKISVEKYRESERQLSKSHFCAGKIAGLMA